MAAETLIVLINKTSDNTPAPNFVSETIDATKISSVSSGKYRNAIIIPTEEDIYFVIDENPDATDVTRQFLVPKGGRQEIYFAKNKRIAVIASGTDVNGSGGGSGGPAPTWTTIAGKPAVVAEGADQAAARTAIGAGTSSIVIGTTATTAMAGNRVFTGAQVALTGYAPVAAGPVAAVDTTNQAIAKLEARIVALETAGG